MASKIVVGDTTILPHDIDTERAVLSALMHYNEHYHGNSDILDENLFFGDKEKKIFRCIEGTILSGNITDINSLCEYAKKHEISPSGLHPSDMGYSDVCRQDFLSIFTSPSSTVIRQDIERLSRISRKRRLWIRLQEAARNILDPTVDIESELTSCIENINDIQSEVEDGVSDLDGAVSHLTEIVNDNVEGKKISLTTGFKIFDDNFLLRPNLLTVIAAFPGCGKSAISMNIAMNIAKHGDGVAYYSLEMGKEELAARALSKDALLPSSIMMNKKLDEYQMRDFQRAVDMNRGLPLYIDERSTVSFDATMSSIRSLTRTKNIKLAVIDYLQIYSQVSENDEASLGYMARCAKNIAKECSIAVILLSQLNRSGAHPTYKMLRGSGQIAESADNIVLIDRPEAHKDSDVKSYEGEFKNESIEGTALFILAKVRGGATTEALLGFNGKYTTFYELDSKMPFDVNTENDKPF